MNVVRPPRISPPRVAPRCRGSKQRSSTQPASDSPMIGAAGLSAAHSRLRRQPDASGLLLGRGPRVARQPLERIELPDHAQGGVRRPCLSLRGCGDIQVVRRDGSGRGVLLGPRRGRWDARRKPRPDAGRGWSAFPPARGGRIVRLRRDDRRQGLLLVCIEAPRHARRAIAPLTFHTEVDCMISVGMRATLALALAATVTACGSDPPGGRGKRSGHHAFRVVTPRASRPADRPAWRAKWG